MTTPTPAAQKAAQSIKHWIAKKTGHFIGIPGAEAIAAIIDREMNQWRPIEACKHCGKVNNPPCQQK